MVRSVRDLMVVHGADARGLFDTIREELPERGVRLCRIGFSEQEKNRYGGILKDLVRKGSVVEVRESEVAKGAHVHLVALGADTKDSEAYSGVAVKQLLLRPVRMTRPDVIDNLANRVRRFPYEVQLLSWGIVIVATSLQLRNADLASLSALSRALQQARAGGAGGNWAVKMRPEERSLAQRDAAAAARLSALGPVLRDLEPEETSSMRGAGPPAGVRDATKALFRSRARQGGPRFLAVLLSDEEPPGAAPSARSGEEREERRRLRETGSSQRSVFVGTSAELLHLANTVLDL